MEQTATALDVSETVIRRLIKQRILPDGYRFEWEVNVVRDRQINAFCLPGGKMIVYTGRMDALAREKLARNRVNQIVGSISRNLFASPNFSRNYDTMVNAPCQRPRKNQGVRVLTIM